MDFNRYCKHCGSEVEEVDPVDGQRAFRCECTDKPLNYKEVIPGFVRYARITQLKAMHQLMLEANDEDIYMTWIYRMPDCPTEEDFIDIALDDEQYNGCFDLFVKLIARDGNRY
jgi:hypothetical protein